jgi:hypothetical protein
MEMQDPTPLSIAQSQIVALQSQLHALDRKVNDLIDIVQKHDIEDDHRGNVTMFGSLSELKKRNLL